MIYSKISLKQSINLPRIFRYKDESKGDLFIGIYESGDFMTGIILTRKNTLSHFSLFQHIDKPIIETIHLFEFTGSVKLSNKSL